MMWASYGLALMGRIQIAETLSKTVCVEIVFVVLGYYMKAGVENLSKNNDWPDRKEVMYGCTDESTGGIHEDSISPTIYSSDSDTSLGIQS